MTNNLQKLIAKREQHLEKEDSPVGYSSQELQAFKEAIHVKLNRALRRQNATAVSLSGHTDNGVDINHWTVENSAVVAERENLVKMTNRQQKFISELYAAIDRIDNGEYGVCIETGQVIDKARLAIVPHTRLSMATKISSKQR